MTLIETEKLARAMMRLLKVRYVSIPVGKTEKGDISLKFTKDQEDFEIVMDAVPLSMKEYDNRELKGILLKYFFEEAEETQIINADVNSTTEENSSENS